MDAKISGRFFRVSSANGKTPDFAELLLGLAASELVKRQRELDGGAVFRIERAEKDADFVAGQFCRIQQTNIPPSAGPHGLMPIELGEGNGLGHVAAFRFHPSTRAFLLQSNPLCGSHSRVSAYVMAVNAAAVYTLTPIFREDALTRLAAHEVRSFTVGFAAPENLEMLDDPSLSSVNGVKQLAAAFGARNVEYKVSVGRSTKKVLDRSAIMKAINAVLGSPLKMDKLKARTDADGEDKIIDFLGETLDFSAEMTMKHNDHEADYKVRHAVLKHEFAVKLDYIKRLFEKVEPNAGGG